MIQPLLLALVGPSGAGKDTAAAYLEDHYAFVRIAFADPLRAMLGALLDHAQQPLQYLTDADRKLEVIPVIQHSYRRLARSLGTRWGRYDLDDTELWIRLAEQRRADAMDACRDNVVITDLRHHNELRWLRRHGGQLVHITRDGKRFHTLDHSSEEEAAQVAGQADHRITNDSTCAHLHDQLDVLMDRLRA